MIEAATRKSQAGRNIFGFEIGKFFKNLLLSEPRGKQIKHVNHPDPHSTNTGPSSALFWIDSLNIWNIWEHLGSDLVMCTWVWLGIHNAADGRIMQAHDSTDFGQAVAVFLMGTANGLIAPCAVGTGTGGEQLAQLRSGGKPLLSWNLFEGALVPESRHKVFDEALAAEEHLPLDVLPG